MGNRIVDAVLNAAAAKFEHLSPDEELEELRKAMPQMIDRASARRSLAALIEQESEPSAIRARAARNEASRKGAPQVNGIRKGEGNHVARVSKLVAVENQRRKVEVLRKRAEFAQTMAGRAMSEPEIAGDASAALERRQLQESAEVAQQDADQAADVLAKMQSGELVPDETDGVAEQVEPDEATQTTDSRRAATDALREKLKAAVKAAADTQAEAKAAREAWQTAIAQGLPGVARLQAAYEQKMFAASRAATAALLAQIACAQGEPVARVAAAAELKKV